ncbi:DUF3800 domain-containing protein [Stenotrophomonas geniculata]
MLYLVYLDEFGHIGPYIARTDPRHKTHPTFGLGGIALPFEAVRPFTSFFFNLKRNLLKFEIDRDGTHPAEWEKKGASLYTLANVQKYQELRAATYRILNRIKKDNGFVFYVGIEKDRSPEESNAKGLYKQVLNEVMKRLDSEMQERNARYMMLLDQQDDMQVSASGKGMRHELVKKAGISMFGADARRALIEPPLQAESHLYQTLQCADWMCGLIGRLAFYETSPTEVPEYEEFEKYFADRLKQVLRRSSIRRKPDPQLSLGALAPAE